ncbi:MAG: acyltransferase [Planctomycetia bacterium]|nr:acyltransferase [Planctomycetia bacterium]
MHQQNAGFEGRAAYIDALRGIAAFGVACYHIARYAPLNEPARKLVPSAVLNVIDHGWVGVQVFFVISGFVIAYSVRNARVTPGYLGNYALRRSIRLDPPYWTTIAYVLLLHAVMYLHLGFDSPLDVPSKLEPELSWRLVVSHLLYLQGILRYDNLSAGFWTLCIEVQFYLLYVTGLGIAQRLPASNRRTPADAGAPGLLLVFAPIALLSLLEWNLTLGGRSLYNYDMWIIQFFSMFFLGAAAWWALDGRIPRDVFWLYATLVAGRIIAQIVHERPVYVFDDKLVIELSAALAAGVSIFVAGTLGKLGTWLNVRVLRYFGKISYSLYLIHFPMSHVVKTLGAWIAGDSPSPLVAGLWVALSMVFSVMAAHVMYTFIEAPSVRLAARLKRAERPAAA